jgi:phage gpG-like protein
VISASLAGDDAAQRRLKALGETAGNGIARAITKLGIELRNSVQQDKLSGQVLRPRSGSLRDGIAVQMDQSRTGVSATVYSNVVYAAAQEFGFAGRENVRASLRRVTMAFGHPITPATVSVNAYSRRSDLPQRSFLRSSLDDMASHIGTAVDDALREALQ